MKSIKEQLKFFSVRKVIKGLFWTVLLSFIYNLIYIYTMFYDAAGHTLMASTAQVVLSLIGSLGIYFICTKCWSLKPKGFTLKKAGIIVAMQAVFIFYIRAILMPLLSIGYSNTLLFLVCQLLAAIGLIFFVPIQITAYYGLFKGIDNIKGLYRYVLNIFKRSYKILLNWYCALLLILIFFDTMMGGQFSIAATFNAAETLSAIFFTGNPMMSWMMILTISSGAPLANMLAVVFIYFVLGIFYGVLELNYPLLVQEQAEEYGTLKNKTYKKKA